MKAWACPGLQPSPHGSLAPRATLQCRGAGGSWWGQKRAGGRPKNEGSVEVARGGQGGVKAATAPGPGWRGPGR